MRILRYVAFGLGAFLILIAIRSIRVGPAPLPLTSIPAALGALLLVLCSWREACTSASRRMVAHCWVVAAGASSASMIVALSVGESGLSVIYLLAAVGQIVAAGFARKRSKVHRTRFYGNYVES